MVKKKNNELILIIFDLSIVLFPKSYVTQFGYSQGLVSPVPNVPKALCSHILYSQGLMFPGSNVPSVLWFQGPGFPSQVLMFPKSYVSRVLCSQCLFLDPMFKRSLFAEALCSQFPLFLRSYVPQLNFLMARINPSAVFPNPNCRAWQHRNLGT